MEKGTKFVTKDRPGTASPILASRGGIITEYRDSVLKTSAETDWMEVPEDERFSDHGFVESSPQQASSSPIYSRLPSRGPSPTEFRPKIRESVDKSLIFPMRRRSERRATGVATAAINQAVIPGARAYELIHDYGRKGDDSHRQSFMSEFVGRVQPHALKVCNYRPMSVIFLLSTERAKMI